MFPGSRELEYLFGQTLGIVQSNNKPASTQLSCDGLFQVPSGHLFEGLRISVSFTLIFTFPLPVRWAINVACDSYSSLGPGLWDDNSPQNTEALTLEL